MGQYGIFTFIICLGTFFLYINHRYIRWTPTIGITVLSFLFSLALLIVAPMFPTVSSAIIDTVASIDFHSLLMDGMLGFLLFAGSIHIDASSLRRELPAVIVLATAGTLLSTFFVGTLLFYILPLFQFPVDYIYCLLFAALISPTDPIAVLAILKRAGLPHSLELKIAGESLFNDGVAVVVFLTILEVAKAGPSAMSAADVSLLFLREAVGGVLFGAALGYTSYRAMKSIDKYEVEVLISIATVMGGYMLAGFIHVSGPLAMVVAGIIVGSKGREGGVSDITRDYLDKFWELTDEILNALLFMLMGFEMLVMKISAALVIIGCCTVVVVLFSRWLSVALPVTLLRRWYTFERHAIAILTWGGLRGGLSVALALSLPADMYRDQFATITYVVVLFSIVVQGLSIGKVYRRLSGQA